MTLSELIGERTKRYWYRFEGTSSLYEAKARAKKEILIEELDKLEQYPVEQQVLLMRTILVKHLEVE